MTTNGKLIAAPGSTKPLLPIDFGLLAEAKTGTQPPEGQPNAHCTGQDDAKGLW